MSRRGHVEHGGKPYIEKLSGTVGLVKLSVGPMDNNAYLLRSVTGVELLIDAANDPDRIAAQAQTPGTIVTTHRHPDHWQGLPDLAARWTPRLVAGRPDVDSIAQDTGVQGLEGLWDGDVIGFGDEQLEVIGLVGHTPGSITLVYRPGGSDTAEAGPVHLFTGDSLFPGGPGKTWTPEDNTSLLDDLEAKIFAAFDDDTVVHPGHGDDTTLGDERPHLPEWRKRGW